PMTESSKISSSYNPMALQRSLNREEQERPPRPLLYTTNSNDPISGRVGSGTSCISALPRCDKNRRARNGSGGFGQGSQAYSTVAPVSKKVWIRPVRSTVRTISSIRSDIVVLVVVEPSGLTT